MTEIFAIMDANGWSIVIGALGIVVMQIVGAVLSYLRDKDKLARLDAAATKVEAVKVALDDSNTKSAQSLEAVHAALDSDIAQGKQTAKVVGVIHTATNSARDKMEERLAEQAAELKAIRAQVEAMHQEATKKAEEKRA